nr:STAS domain-containing protein [uncultured Dethiosulfovibrio sp.]
MFISCEEKNERLVVLLSGRLDTLTAPDLDKAGSGWIEEGKIEVILNFADLEYISSAGLRSVLALSKGLVSQGGKLVLCGVSGMVEEVLSISGFDSFLPIYPDVDGALENF